MSNHMDKYRKPEEMEMIAVPRWLLENSVMCAIYVSRIGALSDGEDMLKSAAIEILERAPTDVDDLIEQYECTGIYANEMD